MYEVGRFAPVAGSVVERRCSDLDDPDHDGETMLPFTELVVSVEASATGAVVDRFEVDYEIGRRRWTEVVDRRFVLCGERVVAEVENIPGAGGEICNGWADRLPPA